jgi:hypothetical protein
MRVTFKNIISVWLAAATLAFGADWVTSVRLPRPRRTPAAVTNQTACSQPAFYECELRASPDANGGSDERGARCRHRRITTGPSMPVEAHGTDIATALLAAQLQCREVIGQGAQIDKAQLTSQNP